MAEHRLARFRKGLVATAELAQRAASNGFLVEYIILAASIVDASLRMALVLQHQIETASSEIPDELLFQGDADKALSERTIYRRSFDKGVISADLLTRLETLYSQRNRVVHRYVISDITTAEVFEIARSFEDTIPIVSAAVGVLEGRQLQLGVGMTQTADTETTKDELFSWAKDKNGADWLARALKKRAS